MFDTIYEDMGIIFRVNESTPSLSVYFIVDSKFYANFILIGRYFEVESSNMPDALLYKAKFIVERNSNGFKTWWKRKYRKEVEHERKG